MTHWSHEGTESSLRKKPENMRKKMTTAGATFGAASTDEIIAEMSMPSAIAH